MDSREERIKVLIDEWKKGDHQTPINEYLGMTLEEYSTYINGGRTLLKG